MKCNTFGYFSTINEGIDRNGNQYRKIYIVDDDNRTYSFKCSPEVSIPVDLKMGDSIAIELQYYDFVSPDGKRVYGFKALSINK